MPSHPVNPSQPLNSQDPPLHLSNKITGTADNDAALFLSGPNKSLRIFPLLKEERKDDHELTTIAAGHGGSTVKPSSREFNTAAEASVASSAETSSKVESSLAKLCRSTSGTEQNLKPQRWISSSVTPNQITSAIAASEKSRLRCSVVVALAAVLSHLGFPLLGSNLISSVINFRPLYLVLLTNVTLVSLQ
ncbi:hypothetical protein D5086_013829 [Populus alba]|uniref:Uncharacterized protein n=2 Tax=Populus alba TaxID=43335 RepID=A0A4U5QGD7_POPAL|nr:hypothetical protein D5086_0000091930 [Populus alba]